MKEDPEFGEKFREAMQARSSGKSTESAQGTVEPSNPLLSSNKGKEVQRLA
jgi:hypothetical protein